MTAGAVARADGGGLPEVQVALLRDFGCRGSGHLCCRGERRGRGSGRRRGVRCRDGWTRLVLRTGDERFGPRRARCRGGQRHATAEERSRHEGCDGDDRGGRGCGGREGRRRGQNDRERREPEGPEGACARRAQRGPELIVRLGARGARAKMRVHVLGRRRRELSEQKIRQPGCRVGRITAERGRKVLEHPRGAQPRLRAAMESRDGVGTDPQLARDGRARHARDLAQPENALPAHGKGAK